MSLEVSLRSFASHEPCKFVMYDLYHHLRRLYRLEHVLPQCNLFYVIAELFGHLITYIGVYQSFSYILKRLGHINFRYLPLAFQKLERPV